MRELIVRVNGPGVDEVYDILYSHLSSDMWTEDWNVYPAGYEMQVEIQFDDDTPTPYIEQVADDLFDAIERDSPGFRNRIVSID